MINLERKLRTEKNIQESGYLDYSKIQVLKNKNFFVVDIPLDGDAPKEYIKAYFYNTSRKAKKTRWSEYFAKYGHKSYPNESVIEYIINQIGEELGFKMNETELVLVNGQIRFLSKNFLRKNEKLIHGIEVLAEYFQDREFVKDIDKDRKHRREYITFELIIEAIEEVYPKNADSIISSFIELLVFDAIVGNNDRHHYNWGLIGDIEKKNKLIRFAPIYDTARGLLWNKTDRDIKKMFLQLNDKMQIKAYLKKSKPRVSYNTNPEANHFELIEYICELNNDYKEIVMKYINKKKEEKIISYFRKNFQKLFILERSELIIKILRLRFQTLRKEIL